MSQNLKLLKLSKFLVQKPATQTFSTSLNDQRNLIPSSALKLTRVTCKDHDKVMRFIEKNYFKDEPLMKALNLVGQCHFDVELQSFIETMIKQGMSIKCVERETQNDILGVSINRRLTESSIKTLKINAKKSRSPFVKRLLETWVMMNTSPCLLHRYNDEEIFDIWLGAVRRDVRNRGLGKHLAEASVCLARELNYKTIAMDCTNKHSSIIAKQIGMKLEWEYPFRQVALKNLDTNFPHTHIQVYARRLKMDDLDKLCKNVKYVGPKDIVGGGLGKN